MQNWRACSLSINDARLTPAAAHIQCLPDTKLGLIANLLPAVAAQENPIRRISAPALFNTCNRSMLN